jgi:hypothetical protein
LLASPGSLGCVNGSAGNVTLASGGNHAYKQVECYIGTSLSDQLGGMAEFNSSKEFHIEFRSQARDDVIIEQFVDFKGGSVNLKNLTPNNRYIYKAHVGELITLKRKNIVVTDPNIYGEMGGRCTCPDGEVIFAGAVPETIGGEACGDLACAMETKKELDCFRNVISYDWSKMGEHGGQCLCPDGHQYKIAESLAIPRGTLACEGGIPGASGIYLKYFNTEWSHKKVKCAPKSEAVRKDVRGDWSRKRVSCVGKFIAIFQLSTQPTNIVRLTIDENFETKLDFRSKEEKVGDLKMVKFADGTEGACTGDEKNEYFQYCLDNANKWK